MSQSMTSAPDLNATRRPAPAVMALGQAVDDLMMTTELTAEQIAARVGASVAEAFDARNDMICWDEGAVRLVRLPDQVRPTVDWFDRPVTHQCAVAWCRGDCVLGGPSELGHSRTLVEAEVQAGDSLNERRRLLVLLQQFGSPGLPSGADETTVYVSTGDTDAYGVNLGLDEAAAFALSILSGVRAAWATR